MITFAQQIHDRTVRHHVLLQRFSDSEVRRIMRLLSRDVFPDILAQAQAITARFEGAGFVRMAGIARRARLERMLAEMSATIRGGASVLHGAIRDPLLPFARAEAEWMLDALRRSTPIEIGFSAAEPQLLRSITTSRPMAGRNLREWSRSVGASTSRRVAQQIRIGVAQGEDTSTIVRRVRGTQANQFRDGVLQTTRREAEAVVRTAVNHTATHARQAVLENNLGAFDYVRWVSVLDARTSRICAPLDGTEWPVDKGPRPPAHSQCRSSIVPVLKPPENLPGIDLSRLPRGTRASLTGPVPADQDFGAWLRRQPRATQEVVLGKGAAEVFRRGKVPFRRFVDVPRLKPLTLRELLALEKRLG